MRKSYGKTAGLAVLLSFAALLASCTTPNASYYPGPGEALSFDPDEAFDLAILEYSEHGNLFRRDAFDETLTQLENLHQDGRPTAIVVFVHGWHHNAAPDDTNLQSFKAMLGQFADRDIGPFPEQRVVGIYLGWRGSSVPIPLLKYLTFWDRKAVAEEVGRGGVTEVLLTLERISRCGNRDGACDTRANETNRIVTIGHSFGGAIVLSALHDVFVDRMVNLTRYAVSRCENEPPDRDGTWNQKRGAPCVNIKPFGHGVVLLNPAIEANQLFPLKEMISRYQYTDEQDTLMHIISTEADLATKYAFPAGQWLNNLTWRETDLDRRFEYPREQPVDLRLGEAELTQTTVGNTARFRTQRYEAASKNLSRCWDKHSRAACLEDADAKPIPVNPNEPIQVIHTDKAFMSGHNDIFNCVARSYLMAVVAESVSIRDKDVFEFGPHYRRFLQSCR